MIVTGLCTGFGSSLGTYLATRYLIKNVEKVFMNGKVKK
jgi:hypothetical protein